MTADNLRFLISLVLGIHGLGHVGAIGALLTRKLGYVAAADQSGWLAPRSWLFPSLDGSAAAAVATGFWILSMLGFIAAALTLWVDPGTGDTWRIIAVVSAVVSAAGIVLFGGTWPVFNTVAALAVDVAVLVTQLWIQWPQQVALGR